MTLGFVLPSALAHRAAAFLWFVFLGPGLCLQLPLHLASRRRSCCSARSSCHQGLQRTFTSKSLPNRFSPPWLPAPVRRCAPCPAHSSSPGQLPTPGPLQIRTRRFPPSGSSVEAARGYGPQIRTVIWGRGSGSCSRRSANRSQVRRVRWLRRHSHLYQARLVASTSSSKLRKFPLTPK